MPKKITRRRPLAALCLLVMTAAAVPWPAQAQDFPNRPIRMITPTPPGGSIDVLARIVAKSVGRTLGQPVVVESRPGASGGLAARDVAKSAPDGYTILLSTSGIFTTNPAIYRQLPYDPAKDFTSLSVSVGVPLLLVANNARPYKSTQELVAHARARPGSVTFASAGPGTGQHLAGELFRSVAKLDMLHIPYKGGAPALMDVVGGQVDMMFVQIPSAVTQLKGGKIRVLGVGTKSRLPSMPDVPTIAESGLTDFDANSWYGFVGPANLPPKVAQSLSDALVKAVTENAAQLQNEGFQIMGTGAREMDKLIARDTQKWFAVIQDAKIPRMD